MKEEKTCVECGEWVWLGYDKEIRCQGTVERKGDGKELRSLLGPVYKPITTVYTILRRGWPRIPDWCVKQKGGSHDSGKKD